MEPLVMAAAAVPVLAHYAERLQRDVWHLLASRVEAGELLLHLVRTDGAAADELGESTVLRSAVAPRAAAVQMMRRQGFVTRWQGQQPHLPKSVPARAAVDAITGPGGAAGLLRMAASGDAAASRQAPQAWPRLALTIRAAVELAAELAPFKFQAGAAVKLPPPALRDGLAAVEPSTSAAQAAPPQRAPVAVPVKLPRECWKDGKGHWTDDLFEEVERLSSQSGGGHSMERIAAALGVKRASLEEAMARRSKRRDRANAAAAGGVRRRA